VSYDPVLQTVFFGCDISRMYSQFLLKKSKENDNTHFVDLHIIRYISKKKTNDIR